VSNRQICAVVLTSLILATTVTAQDKKPGDWPDNPYEKIDKIRQEKVKALRERMTKKYDKNDDGKLSSSESRAASPEYRKEVSAIRDELEGQLDKSFDNDGNGSLSPSEDHVKRIAERKYAEVVRARELAERQRRIEAYRKKQLLRKYDANDDGKLDEAETAKMEADQAAAKAAMVAAEQKLLAKFDADKDGKFNKEEMAKVLEHLTGQLRVLKSYVDISRDKKTRDDSSWDDIEDTIREFRFRSR
jgi:Ca2+-binding EF-hand superfamily protein